MAQPQQPSSFVPLRVLHATCLLSVLLLGHCVATVSVLASVAASDDIDHAAGPGLIGRSLLLDRAFGLPSDAGVFGLTPDLSLGVLDALVDVHQPLAVRIDGALLDLTAAYTNTPLVVRSEHPRFSWQLARIAGERDLQQTAYRLRVRQTTPVQAADEQRVLDHDSGFVHTADSLHVRYDGPALLVNTAYNFSLQYILSDGRPSAITTGPFRTGIVLRSDSAAAEEDEASSFVPVASTSPAAEWIGDEENLASQFRFDFDLAAEDVVSIVSAEVLLAATGYGELYLNGAAVDSTRKLDPAWTEYEFRMLYSTYSVQSMLQAGANTVGVWLGNGWWAKAQWTKPLSDHRPVYTQRRFSLTLQAAFKNGTRMVLASNASTGQWRARMSPVVSDGLYSGEIDDYRLSNPDWCAPPATNLSYHWHPVQLLDWPTASLQAATMPPVRVIGTMTPVGRTTWNTGNSAIYDMGQSFTGWLRITVLDVTETRGIPLTIRYAETMAHGETQTLYTASNRGSASTDTIILSGVEGEVYEVRFTYHGGRYIEIIGIPGNNQGSWNAADNLQVEGVLVHSYAPQTGKLKLNHTVLDQTMQNIIWSAATNLMSVPTACAQRDERIAFDGDIGLAVDSTFFNLDALGVHDKYLDDQEIDQRADGSYDITAPTNNHAPGGVAQPNWGIGFPRIMWAAWEHFQDTALLSRHYDSHRRWTEWLEAQYNASGLAGIYGSAPGQPGDWVPPPPSEKCSRALTAAFAYMANMDIFINVSRVLGNWSASEHWAAIYAARAVEYHEIFYTSGVGYAEGYQTCNAVTLALPQVVPAELRANVSAMLAASVVSAGYHVTTGIVGTAQLFRVLSANGYHDVAMQIATGVTYPSYGYQFNNPYEPATTVWELWDADRADGSMNSRNLIMFTSIGSWFWRYCAGIQLDGDSGRLLRLEPLLPSPELNLGIHSMDASYASTRGLIRVAWSRTQSQSSATLHSEDKESTASSSSATTVAAGSGFDRMSVHITVPHNVQSRVRIPHPHPSRPTDLQQLWEYEAAEGSAADSARATRRQLLVERVAADSERKASEPLATHSQSRGVQHVRWLTAERVLELHLSSGSFGFDLTFAVLAAQSAADAATLRAARTSTHHSITTPATA